MMFYVPPERVYEVLSDPYSYAHWVVGSRSVDVHDHHWPQPGSRFGHTQGKWPLLIKDETESIASDPARRLELVAKARPVLVARVIMNLQRQDGGTRVVMEEKPEAGIAAPFLRLPPGRAATRWRNRHSLRRLKELAEAR